MAGPAADAAVAAIVALGCACVANLVLGRRPRSLFEWNESFLIGVGIVAAASIPLSLWDRPWMRFALLIATLLAIAVRAPDLAAIIRRLRDPEFPSRSTRAAAIAAAPGLALFAVANARSGFVWDGFQIWMTKAHEFAETGNFRLAVPTPDYMLRIVGYPPAVPVAEALIAGFFRSFPFEGVKGIFPVFALSLLVGTFRLVESLTDRRTAMMATALTSILPALALETALGGDADMPLAAVVAAAAASSIGFRLRTPSWRDPAPWLLGTLTMVKSEGSVLLLIGLGVFVVSGLASRGSFSGKMVSAAAPLAFFGAARAVQRIFIPGVNIEFAPLVSLRPRTVLERGPAIVSRALHWLSDFPRFGFLWPAFAVALLAVIGFARRSRAAAIGIAALLAIVADAAVFFWTRWGNFRLHLDQAYPRLVAQVAPLAVATIAAAFRLRVPAPETNGPVSRSPSSPTTEAAALSRRGSTLP